MLSAINLQNIRAVLVKARKCTNAVWRQEFALIEHYFQHPLEPLPISDSEQTALALAKILGLPPSAVDGGAKRPAEAGDAEILIVLGDDAKEPGPGPPSCC